ncbi:MAG: hypothetical protein IPL65_18660 [Lewinellaceae bacterium]|nr:hypothetical protein [Lewinellaceae bacterium]
MVGSENRSTYHRFDAADFQPSSQHFALELGGSSFSASGIRLDLPEVKGSLRFKGNIVWPKMLGAPGIMGWYSFVPFMECFHGIVSLNHSIEGKLVLDGEDIDFTGGKGYMEKDWGRSFPRAYVDAEQPF